jgi:hypothetical protein
VITFWASDIKIPTTINTKPMQYCVAHETSIIWWIVKVKLAQWTLVVHTFENHVVAENRIRPKKSTPNK